ncbi:hypothetical protein FACS1894162_3810 [Bacteroidia bacterium]|nr:hypothetical protein FACS1894162_3810 [Bacteroidia bacterium]
MKEKAFKEWLGHRFLSTVVNSRIANCKNVEKYYNDLDTHFEKDRCEKIISELAYSTDDQRENKETKHPIPIDGNKYTGSATLKQAVRRYVEFRDDIENGFVANKKQITDVNQSYSPSAKSSLTNNSRYRGNAIGNAQNLLIRNILSNLGKESFKKTDWEETKKYFSNRCAYCGKKAKLIMEHAVPINKDKLGEHRIGNIVPSCVDCNKSKHHKDYKEFLGENVEAIKKIDTYMKSRNYVPLEDSVELKKILNEAHNEVGKVAAKYVTIINELFMIAD